MKCLDHIPKIVQKNDWYCAPAVVQRVLKSYKIMRTQDKLAEKLGTSEEFGTSPIAIKRVLLEFGLSPRIVMHAGLDLIKHCIDVERCMIVDYQAAWKDERDDYFNEWDHDHYAVLIGYNTKYLLLRDPSSDSDIVEIEIPNFFERWHGCRKGEDGRLSIFWQLGIIV